MKRPVIKPKRDEATPCEGHSALFLSPNLSDHASARILCRGSKRLDVPPCPFIGWCEQEREGTQRDHGVYGVEGTWHGVLFVDGRIYDTARTVALIRLSAAGHALAAWAETRDIDRDWLELRKEDA